MYTKEQVEKATLKYFNGDSLATNAWIAKYALRDNFNNLLELTPDDMHRRLAKEYARIENKYPNPLSEETIYNLLKGFKYVVPGGSPNYGIGNPYSISSLGNCFVIGNKEDSYGGIMLTDQEQVQLMKRRGGVGHDLSHIRPNNTPVTNSAGTSTGAISFMTRFSNSTREVGQEGRRGALMLSLDINHPDIEEFITAKDDTTKITGANISVKVTDEFMQAVENDNLFTLEFKNAEGKRWFKDVTAKRIWNKLMHQAWKNAEPGVLFWDKVINESPADCYEEFETVSTNPCGEIPLNPYDSCRLLHINLYSYVKNPFTAEASFDFDKFEQDVIYAQKLMDDTVDLEEEKIEAILNKIDSDPESSSTKRVESQLWLEIKDKLIKGRRTGLGVTGEADMLAALGYKYDNDEAITFSEMVHKTIAHFSYKSSIQMAEERGCFSVWDLEEEQSNPFIKRIMQSVDMETFENYRKYGRRNIANLTIAPTGTTSLMTQTSSGIEPVFQVNYKRRRKVEADHPNKSFQDDNGDWWEEYNVFHKPFKDWLDVSGLTDTGDNIERLIKLSPYYQTTANEINYDRKIEMQGKIQRWVDHSISVTHNLPENITEKEVSRLYMKSWKEGCKGMTIYRQGSRDGVLLENSDSDNVKFDYNNAIKRPKKVQCDVLHPTIKGEDYVVMVGIIDNKPYEVFAFKKNGVKCPKSLEKGILKKQKRGIYNLLDMNEDLIVEDIAAQFKDPEQEDITRLLSWGLRHGGGIKHGTEVLNKSRSNLMSYSKLLSRQLKRYIPDGEKSTGLTCPECSGEDFKYENNCPQCLNCGWTQC